MPASSYLHEEVSEEHHLFAQEDDEGVRRLFWHMGVPETLSGLDFAERPMRKMTESELSMRSGRTEEPDPIELSLRGA